MIPKSLSPIDEPTSAPTEKSSAVPFSPIIGTNLKLTVKTLDSSEENGSHLGLNFVVIDRYFNDEVKTFDSKASHILTGKGVQDIGSLSLGIYNSPDRHLNIQHSFSVQWTGYFYAPASGTYIFTTTSHDASYLWIGAAAASGYTTANALVKNGGKHTKAKVSAVIVLSAGVYYPIRIQYGEQNNKAECIVAFTPPGGMSTTNGLNYYYSKPLSPQNISGSQLSTMLLKNESNEVMTLREAEAKEANGANEGELARQEKK